MGVLLYERGRVAEAQRFLLTASGMDPSLGAAHSLLAEIRAGQHQPVYQVARANVTPAPHSLQPGPASSATPAAQVVLQAPVVEQPPVIQPAPVTPVAPEPTLAEAPQIVETMTPDMPAIDAPALLPPVN
jgi:hypothetical protein